MQYDWDPQNLNRIREGNSLIFPFWQFLRNLSLTHQKGLPMELVILSKTENELEIEFKGETHTLLNLLKDLLIKDERVEIAFYDIKHVSISDPVFYIKTDGSNPLEVLKDAANKIIVECDEFTDAFNKAVNAWNILEMR